MTPTTAASSQDKAADSTLDDQDARLPRRNAKLFGLFRKYVRGYVRRHFHALRIDRDGVLPELPPGPVIAAVNHPSWWDPMIGLVLTGELPDWRAHYAPIDVVGLAQYPFLERLGFYGVEVGTPRGGLRFLHQSLAILSRPESMLWITVQGHFVDPRERPIRIKAGVGHLAHRQARGTILPVAIEYPFWNDRLPEALVRFGSPIEIQNAPGTSPGSWTTRLESALEETQDLLAERARLRDPDQFVTLLGGKAGVGGIYDSWRRLKARLRGRTFRPDHQTTGAETP